MCRVAQESERHALKCERRAKHSHRTNTPTRQNGRRRTGALVQQDQAALVVEELARSKARVVEHQTAVVEQPNAHLCVWIQVSLDVDAHFLRVCAHTLERRTRDGVGISALQYRRESDVARLELGEARREERLVEREYRRVCRCALVDRDVQLEASARSAVRG